jgi:DNA-binding transcriptional regulator YiaG
MATAKKQTITQKNELDDGSTISFETFLSNNYGKPGTVERKLNDTKLDAIEMMQVIKEMRKNEKIKLKTVAANLGVDESVVSKMENTNKDIQLGTLANYIQSMKGHMKLTFTIGNHTQVLDLV